MIESLFSAALPCVRADAGAGRAHGLYAVPGDGTPDGVLAPGRQPRAGAVPRHAARGAGFGAALLCPRQRVAGADPGVQVPRGMAHGAGDGRVVRPLPEGKRIVRRRGGGRALAAAPRQALPPRVQPVRIHRRRDCRAAGRGGRPPQRAPEAQYGEPGPQGAPRPGPQCRGCVRRRPSRAACGAARPAGGRRVHHGQHDAFVRRGDSALGARLPHQHRRARRLTARSGREGVGCGNYFSTGRTFPQGRVPGRNYVKT